MRRHLVDLSQPIRTAMPVYPGDPAVAIVPALTVAADGVNVLRLHLGSQSGTHVDAPFHVRDDLPDLDTVPLERFIGPAVLVDARTVPPRGVIGPAALDPVRARLAPGTVVLLVTGWSRYWDTPYYLAHPWPAPALATDLVAAGVRTVGIDALSVDVTPPAGQSSDGPPDLGLPTHLVLAGAGCVIAENLRGLEPLLDAQRDGATIEVSLLPLRLEHSDGAPIRAVAIVIPPQHTSATGYSAFWPATASTPSPDTLFADVPSPDAPPPVIMQLRSIM